VLLGAAGGSGKSLGRMIPKSGNRFSDKIMLNRASEITRQINACL
jgi:hypothetical protein